MSQAEDSRSRQSASYEAVAVAASAGGVGALSALLGSLAADFPVPIMIVQHLDPRHQTVIAEVLTRRTALQVKLAEDGEMPKPGVAYVAPPNRHLLITPARLMSLSDSELVHFLRPSADLLFESFGSAYGDTGVAVVLTGTGSDGAMGVRAVHARGGTVIVQSPDSSEFNGMPSAAAATGTADFVLDLDEIGPVLTGLFEQGSRR